jgi:phage terminase large subunit-like protein
MEQSPADRLAALPEADRRQFLASLAPDEAAVMLHDWRGFLARPSQIAPDGAWSIWLVLAGRGFGKTRIGSEWVREMVCGATPLAGGQARRIALIAETAADARDVIVEGDSGILSVHPKEYRPLYEPSKRRVTWPNGAQATLFNAVEPDQLRGPQHDLAWGDELAKWRYARETYDQLQFGMRLGAHPRQLFTTTPRPIELVKELVKQANTGDDVVITRGRTLDNAGNLAAPFLKRIKDRYEGTRLGRQELDGEVLEDMPGALWTRRMLDEWRVPEAPGLKRIVVSVDPSGSDSDDADDIGIGAAGSSTDNRGFFLEDATMQGTPEEWGRTAVGLYHKLGADLIVAESNYGGQMVQHVIRSIDPNVPVKLVHASRGKHVRAEPISALYEQGRIAHVGAFPELEDEMCLMTSNGYMGERSPNRLDALVWAFTELFPAMVQPVEKVSDFVMMPTNQPFARR